MTKNRVNTTTTTATANTDEYINKLYAIANRAVSVALRSRHEKSGLDFLADLQNSKRNDDTASNNRAIAERIADLETLHDSTAESAEFYTARANNLLYSNEERAHAHKLATVYRAEVKRINSEIATLYNALNTTYSDRADLVQIAVEQLLIVRRNPAPITKKVLASYGAECVEDLTKEERAEAQARANFRAVVNAVGRGISTIPTPDALNSHTTKAEPITTAEAQAYINRYGENAKIPHTTKRTSASQCYITIEYRDSKKMNGWYKVIHYATTAPYQYIETHTEDENGETDIAYLKTYNPYVSNETDIERIEELAERANLTEREKLFLTEYANRCRYDGNAQAVRKYAMESVGIFNRSAQDVFFSRLKSKLVK